MSQLMVVKRNGHVVEFDIDRIKNSIAQLEYQTNEGQNQMMEILSQLVYIQNSDIRDELFQDIVQKMKE